MRRLASGCLRARNSARVSGSMPAPGHPAEHTGFRLIEADEHNAEGGGLSEFPAPPESMPAPAADPGLSAKLARENSWRVDGASLQELRLPPLFLYLARVAQSDTRLEGKRLYRLHSGIIERGRPRCVQLDKPDNASGGGNWHNKR